jgi:hypothetical protein
MMLAPERNRLVKTGSLFRDIRRYVYKITTIELSLLLVGKNDSIRVFDSQSHTETSYSALWLLQDSDS